ncbi:hypothetical protein GCM10023095_03820 [Pseudaeromonas paramecii]|uniref:SGNH/GDSL hydrolase family protein n=1 Tax=Pseudaeromonas paramecii TaxID=2138166 RepID=A0ABP8PYW6_9GAMM
MVGESLAVEAMAGFIITAVQWMRDGVAIAGETGMSYQLTVADEGSIVYPLVTGYSPVSAPVPNSGVIQQELVPFSIGTLDFAMASLDANPYGTAYLSHAERMFEYDGETVDVICDASSGADMSYWHTNVLPNILARTATPDLVVSLANPLGNDTSNAVAQYGRADAAPVSHWTNAMSLLADGVAQLKAAGFKVIVGNTSYRNYGLDNSCRTDEDKGAQYANRIYLEPWIKANLPECWNIAADRPMLDHYNYTWNIADWAVLPGDGVHHTEIGKSAIRRYNYEIITAMSRGDIPVVIEKRTWPDVGLPSSDIAETIFGIGGSSTLNSLPTNINKGLITASAVINTLVAFPAQCVDTSGQSSPVKPRAYGWYGYNSNGRGNTGDATTSLTNNFLLKGLAFIDNNFARNVGVIELGGLTPFGRYKVRYQASASVSATVGDKVSRVRCNSWATYQDHVSDEADPSAFLEFTAHADALGYIYLLVTLADGATLAYVSGVSVASVS